MAKYAFPRAYTNVFSGGDLPMSITWIAGMTPDEFAEWREFVMLTLRAAERNVVFPIAPVEPAPDTAESK
jgi:hypothetical protein